jgi:oligosaccharide repeat unit polymerase
MYEIYKNNMKGFYTIYLYVFILLTLGASIVEGARSGFVLMFLEYMVLYIYMKGGKNIYKPVLLFLSLFFVLSIFTRGVGVDNLFETLYNFFEHFVMYAFGSIISFEAFLEDRNISVFSGIMINFTNKINNILDILALNIHKNHPELQQTEFVYIGDNINTNVYSFLSVRISYFGFIGAGISMLVHAMIITIVYKLKENSIYMFVLYMLMIPTTILTLFHEYFFEMIPYYLRAVILVFILYHLKPYRYIVGFLGGKKKCVSF